MASGPNSHAEGGGTTGTTASGPNSHAEGAGTTASGPNSHAEGAGTTASGSQSHAEGAGTTASGQGSHAEGASTKALGSFSHAEGVNTKASKDYSHSEGAGTTASGNQSHAEGASTEASGDSSHAEGAGTKASGNQSHAEGANTKASGGSSHAEGASTEASGDSSHAEGGGTKASGDYSHAEGSDTIANHKSQHVIGEYNIADLSPADATKRGNYVCIIGNGTSNNARSNALAMKWDGTLVLSDGTEVTQTQIKALLNTGITNMIFTVTYDTSVEPPVTSTDTTFDNIKQAYKSGRSIFAKYIYNEVRGASQYALMPLSGYIAYDTGEITQFNFSFTTIAGGDFPRMIWLEVGKASGNTYAYLCDKQMDPRS